MNDLTIILRECGERTADAACSSLNSPELGGNVERVSEVPFSACLRKSLEVGLSAGRKWTLCIDADVLVDTKAIQQLIHYAEETPSHVFEVQGFVFDKFFGVERPAGNHLYRTELLEKSLPLIPEEGTTLRPENTLLNNMTAEGHPCVQSPIVVGLHDFEQWEHNVFTRAFLQAHKHDWLANYGEGKFRGFQNRDQEIRLDLTERLPDEVSERFDVILNHTTLEHIYNVSTAFENLCRMTRDLAIVIVPFCQIQHETPGYEDFWRFTPTCLRRLFADHQMEVVYEAANNDFNAALYLLFVASKAPDQWREKMPQWSRIEEAASWVGRERVPWREIIAMIKRRLGG